MSGQLQTESRGCCKRTVNSFILTLIIDIVEVAQHLQCGYMRARIVNDPLRAIFDQILQEDKGLADWHE